jgi:hypothetical protein
MTLLDRVTFGYRREVVSSVRDALFSRADTTRRRLAADLSRTYISRIVVDPSPTRRPIASIAPFDHAVT